MVGTNWSIRGWVCHIIKLWVHSDWLQSHLGRLVKVCRQLLLSPSWWIKVILTTDNKELPPWSPSSKHGRNNFGCATVSNHWSQVLHQNSAASSGHLKNCSVWRYIELWLNLFDASGFVTSGSYLQQKISKKQENITLVPNCRVSNNTFNIWRNRYISKESEETKIEFKWLLEMWNVFWMCK